MMFFKKFEDRIESWREFRDSLEQDSDPVKTTIEFWNKAPISAMSCDPFDQNSWPLAWQLIDENKYCDFSKILAIYYTLKLTDRFKDSYFEIQIANDKKEHRFYYLLIIDDNIVGYRYDSAVTRKELPNLWINQSYVMRDDI
jgi:hypothetical protein